MNPYKEDGPCARLSFDPAYCKRCTVPPSVNDGYITGTGCRSGRLRTLGAGRACQPQACGNRPPRARWTPVAAVPAPPGRPDTLSRRLKLSFGNAATGPL